jgi:T-complex protein 1 subunit eta
VQKCCSHPCWLQSPKILLLNIELELKSEKENAEVRLDDPAKYQSIVDAGAHSSSCPAW